MAEIQNRSSKKSATNRVVADMKKVISKKAKSPMGVMSILIADKKTIQSAD